MNSVKWSLSSSNAVGNVSKELYGGFVEHLGRNVYGGVYEPTSPVADEDGFRKDVLELIRELDMPVTRYPGGCYVDLERWEDSVGPNRRSRLDPAWHQLEPNTFGLDEFMKWARKANTEPLMTINVGNRSLLDTLSIYEYCNFPGGTYWSDQRRANGVEKPYNIKNWCIGNELYGSWEMGQMSAAEYGRLAREHGKLLKKLDPNCRIIVSGSPYDMQWNRTVLDLCGKYADVLSLHDAFSHIGNMSELDYLKTVDRFENYLCNTIKECQAYEALSGKKIKISVDEWILWDFERRMDPSEEWTAGMHLLEQDYNILDALVAGSLFSCFHRHADWVDIACIAQSVNVIAPIRTEKDGTSWKQSIYHPFQLTSCYGRGLSLKPEESGNEAAAIYGSAVLNEQENLLTVFVTNRAAEPCNFELEFAGAKALKQSLCMYCSDHKLTNSPTCDELKPQALECSFDGKAQVTLAANSWNMLQLSL